MRARGLILSLLLLPSACRPSASTSRVAGDAEVIAPPLPRVSASSVTPTPSTAPPRARGVQDDVLEALVRDIEALRARCPQLAAFDAKRDLHAEERVISYDFHTHAAARRGGWRSGVPEPDRDGVWLYIDIHRADSTAQIHTQPFGLPSWDVAGDRLLFIMFEGEKTHACYAEVKAAIEKRVAGASSPSTTP